MSRKKLRAAEAKFEEVKSRANGTFTEPERKKTHSNSEPSTATVEDLHEEGMF